MHFFLHMYFMLFVVSGSLNWEEIYRNSNLVCCKGNYTFSEGRTDFWNNSIRISMCNEGMIYKADCTPENYGLYFEDVGKSEKTLFLSGDDNDNCSKLYCIWLKYMTINVSHGTCPLWLYDEIAGSGCSNESTRGKGMPMLSSSNHSDYLEKQTRPTLNQSGSLFPNNPLCTGYTITDIVVAIICTAVVTIICTAVVIYSGVLSVLWDCIKRLIWSRKAVVTSKDDPCGIKINEIDGLVSVSEVTDGLDQIVPRTMSTGV